MVSAAEFSLFVTVMFWCAIAMFGLSLALVALLLVVRMRSIARHRRTRRLVAVWRDVFAGILPNRRRRIHKRDAFTVLKLWSDVHTLQTNGLMASPKMLLEVADSQGFDQLAARLLTHGDAGDRLVALTFLGSHPLPVLVDDIRPCALALSGELALAAHRALVAIEPGMMRGLADAIAARDDFRPRTVEETLRAIGPQTTSSAMAEAAMSYEGAGRVRILRYFALIDAALARSTLRNVLATDDDPDVVAAALRALAPLSATADRPALRRFFNHRAPFVRSAAIGALVRICDSRDRSALIKLLGDRDAGVRYHAARALVECFMQEGFEGDLGREIAWRYGRDALKPALLERSVVDLVQFVEDATRAEPRRSNAIRAGN